MLPGELGRRLEQESKKENTKQTGFMSELSELFLDELADILSAEQMLLKALPKMAKSANNDELREAFEMHLEETEAQIERIKQVFELFGKPAKAKKCDAMEGLVKEGEKVMQEWKGSAALDAALIAAAQKVEHYEIATYGTLCTWLEMIGNEEALDLLKETMDEEESTDERLTDLAETCINEEATQEGEEEEEEEPAAKRSTKRSTASKNN
jgi:ferritin-like metal-binding protein YciE